MNTVRQPFAIAFVLLLLLPLVLLMTGWHWQPAGDDPLLRGLWYVTDTAGGPFAVIVSLFFVILFVALFRGHKKRAVTLAMMMLAVVVAGQGVKVVMKNTLKEPRPYVVWLEQQRITTADDFYDLKRQDRAALLGSRLQGDYRIPAWQLKHWQSETGYSFPSGHALFASAWTLMLFSFFWIQRRTAVATVILLWGLLAEYSRMALGMHWPADIIMAVVINGLLAAAMFWFIARRMKKPGNAV